MMLMMRLRAQAQGYNGISQDDGRCVHKTDVSVVELCVQIVSRRGPGWHGVFCPRVIYTMPLDSSRDLTILHLDGHADHPGNQTDSLDQCAACTRLRQSGKTQRVQEALGGPLPSQTGPKP